MKSPATPIRRNLLVLASVAAFAAVGGAFAAQAAGNGPHAMSFATSSDLVDHIAQFSEHIDSVTGATAEQKAQIDPLLRQAGTDLAALHAQLSDSHARAIQALTQDQVDRTALENARAEHIRIADQMSQRLAKLAADIADVLTPAQRKALGARIAQHHAAGHMGLHGG